ncbi:MAG: SCP2 sterol-binding domain-containing protein [Rhodocyclaceae bacterium]|jgi:predicted lipid carrier protein YhbT|nr:SCP2 sterol-binding domain-containing protein [Rhodocyclaceae bacterium]
MINFKLPDFTLPAPLARFGGKLPQLPPTLALVTGLNLALGRLIPREPLEMLVGKRFVIRVKDAGMTLRFAYGERGFRPVFDAAAPDLTISARTRDFIALLAREEDPDTLFFNRRLLMEGDTDLGLLVKNTLDGIDLPRFDPARLAPAELLHRLRARLATPHGA